MHHIPQSAEDFAKPTVISAEALRVRNSPTTSPPNPNELFAQPSSPPRTVDVGETSAAVQSSSGVARVRNLNRSSVEHELHLLRIPRVRMVLPGLGMRDFCQD